MAMDYEKAALTLMNAQLRSDIKELEAEHAKVSKSYEILWRQWREQQISFNRVRQQELSDRKIEPSLMDQYSKLRENQVKSITSLGAWNHEDIVNTAGWSGAAFLWLLAIGAIIGRIE